MLLINPRYHGRFHEKAAKLVKSGTRVGMMWVSGEKDCSCHVCNKDFPTPVRDGAHLDAWGECPHCKTPFVFAWVR